MDVWLSIKPTQILCHAVLTGGHLLSLTFHDAESNEVSLYQRNTSVQRESRIQPLIMQECRIATDHLFSRTLCWYVQTTATAPAQTLLLILLFTGQTSSIPSTSTAGKPRTQKQSTSMLQYRPRIPQSLPQQGLDTRPDPSQQSHQTNQ